MRDAELGQVIGVVVEQKDRCWKLYVTKGALKDGSETYKTRFGTVNIKVLNETGLDFDRDYKNCLVKCSIRKSFVTGIFYGSRNTGTGYEVYVKELVENDMNLDY